MDIFAPDLFERNNILPKHTIDYIENLTLSDILKDQENVDWNYIVRYKNISEDFILKLKKCIISRNLWKYVCAYQQLSEGFIRNALENKYDIGIFLPISYICK